jgi:hypothetical protein
MSDSNLNSRSTLPLRPDIEHLRREARQLLKEMRKQQPDARLADVQFQLARNYGFATWQKLKSHVDAVTNSHKALIEAVRVGDQAIIRTILHVHPQLVNASTDLAEHLIRPSDARTMRLVHLAIAENQKAVLELLIQYGADLNVRNEDNRLPLHDCFELGRDDLAQRLLAAGAQPDVCVLAAYGMSDRLRDLLQSTPEAANDLQTGISPLGWCVYGGSVDCAQILVAHGAILDRPPFDIQAWKPAAHVANTDFARFFLKHAVNPNARDSDGNTPLHLVVQSRLVLDPADFVKTLLAGGADPSMRNNAGNTVLHEAEEQVGRYAQTYFPARATAVKNLGETISIFRSELNL